MTVIIKYNGYSTLYLCNVIFSIAQKFLCVCLAMCISIYIYDCCVFAVNQGVFAVHATFGPLHRGGSRQWNQEVLCLSPPSSASLPLCTASRTTSVQSSGDEECSAAEGEVQRKWPHPPPTGPSLQYEASSASH